MKNATHRFNFQTLLVVLNDTRFFVRRRCEAERLSALTSCVLEKKRASSAAAKTEICSARARAVGNGRAEQLDARLHAQLAARLAAQAAYTVGRTATRTRKLQKR